jgi:ketosteroid isomerase-like protein
VTEQENVEAVRRIYERWLDNDPALFDNIDPAVELNPDPAADWVGVDDVYVGHDGFRRYMRQVYDAFEDYRPEVEEIRGEGERVVTLAIEHGRGRASGTTVKAHRTAHVWTMRDGKAIRLDLYLDRAKVPRS